MIDADKAGAFTMGALGVCMAIADFWGKRWENSHPVKKADQLAAASVDVGKVLESYEVRELNLTAHSEDLMRQNAENARLHNEALTQLSADRDADRAELRELRDALGGYREDVEEYKRLHEGCELRLLQLQNSFEASERAHREIVTAMSNQLDTKDRRGYHAAKIAERASPAGPFTATDVFPEGKPKP